jgi:hypothetical protein
VRREIPASEPTSEDDEAGFLGALALPQFSPERYASWQLGPAGVQANRPPPFARVASETLAVDRPAATWINVTMILDSPESGASVWNSKA